MAALTEEMKKQYLQRKGICCPFCGSNNIDAGFFEIDGEGGFQNIRCMDCEGEWNDIYKLVDVTAE